MKNKKPKHKLKKNNLPKSLSFKVIKPIREKCDCGKEVKNHHWFCDSCWREMHIQRHGKTRKNKFIINERRLNKL